jgi:RNA polymerase sigma-70 factor (ECF subfamily)
MDKSSENIVLFHLKKGDDSSFKIIFSNYYQPLFVFAQKFVDEELAKDFVQDCFFELWQNREKINIKSSLSAYLFTVVKNKCYKHLKGEKEKFHQQNNLGLQLKQKEIDFFINSEKSILEFGIKDRLSKLIDRLPEKCAEVFMESRFNGLTNKEISEKYHISIKAVEKQITKALQLFRKEFKDIISILVVLFSSLFS